MSVSSSALNKGETLLDTAVTLNAMNPDLLVIRMAIAGPWHCWRKSLLRRFERRRRRTRAPDPSPAGCADHKAAFGKIKWLKIAICGDITHSRVALNLLLLNAMGAQVNLVGPRTLIPADAERLGANIFHTMREGLEVAIL